MLPISAVFCGFVILCNLSLKYNDVGLYQLFKTLTTPCIVAAEFVLFKKRFPVQHLLALGLICVGVLLAAVSSLNFNTRGAIFGLYGFCHLSRVFQPFIRIEC